MQTFNIMHSTPAGIELAQRKPHVIYVCLPGVGGLDRAPGSIEELDAERLFEQADLLGQRGLRDVQHRGSTCETALLRDGEKIPDLA